ncbi:MAG: FMN-binding protein [Bacteroidota bacterium]
MLKGNNKRLGVWALCFVAFLFFSFTSTDKITPRLQQKLNAAVQSTFELETFALELIEVSADVDARTKVVLNGEHLFRVTEGDVLSGYAYLGQAPSMKDVFDYVVLFNPDLSIKKSKVLIYRENYGRQIGSQRWLKQFIGKRSGDPLTYGETIDAISGATISAKSMTKAVAEVLESITVLQREGVVQ